MEQRTVDRLVTPFYLKMMRTNAVSYGAGLERELVGVGLDASTQDVISLLRVPWRSTVMGAWFSLLRDDDEVTAEVLGALSRSHGSLDSPPLRDIALRPSGQRRRVQDSRQRRLRKELRPRIRLAASYVTALVRRRIYPTSGGA